MREWNYVVSHPASLVIASDARLSPADNGEDQVWELNMGSSEPPAVAIYTTFGLKARSCSIFPRFSINGATVNNPKEFHRPIIIHRYYPNYINLSCRPFHNINVVLEYWVPDKRSITCRAKIINTGRDKCEISIEWAEVLIATEDGHRMSASEIDLATILTGRTANLSPVLFVSGGAEPGKSPYPSLDLSRSILPHQEQEVRWSHAALEDINDSYEHAKSIINRNWDTEIARISRINSQRIEIATGDPDWDTAFYLSQTIADQLRVKVNGVTKGWTYLNLRRPDQGNSGQMAGTQIKSSGTPQTTHGAYYLMNLILPTAPDDIRDLLDDFLASQDSPSEVDPPAIIQPGQIPDTPLLACIAWEYYRYSGRLEFLRDHFQALLTGFQSWFTASHDRDNDSIPEWDQPVQTGFEENPLFSFMNASSAGLDITTVECPDLCAYLYNESQALISIAKEIGDPDPLSSLQAVAATLKTMVDQTWDDAQACYLYRDRDSHFSAPLQVLGMRSGSGMVEIHQEFNQPVRPLIRIKTNSESTKPVQIYLQGVSVNGSHRVDHIEPSRIHWHINYGYTTSQFAYKNIEQIEVTGLSPRDEVIVSSAGYSGLDMTMLIPLWAGIPSEDKAKILANLTVTNKKKYLGPFGIRSYVDLENAEGTLDESWSVYPQWLNFIARGLLRYGERKKAAELQTRLLKTVVGSINKDLTFHPYYQSETGKPQGNANSLFGLVPVGLFLAVLGITILSPTRIEITGGNPFPWPVTIRYRGLTVVHEEKKTLLIFSDGQNVTVDNQQPKMIIYNMLDPKPAITERIMN